MKQTTNILSGKTKVTILLTVFVISLLLLLVAFWACRYCIKAEAHARYTGVMNVASEKIAKTISGMEMNAMNVFDEVQKHMDSPEAVVEALKSKTSLNPDVRGYFAAFEPNHFPEKGRWYEPYVHQTDTSSQFQVSQVGSARHDYTQSEWYVKAKELKMSFWSDPYYYYDGTSISGHYCTFVEPIYDETGKLVCVCGADMTFEWLTKELKQIDYSSKEDKLMNKYLLNEHLNYYTVVLNSDGSCIAYPEGKSVSMEDENVISNLKLRQSGTVDMKVNGEPVVVYYGPISHIGWSVAVVVPKDDIQVSVQTMGSVLLVIMALGMIVVWVILRRVRYAEVV